MIEVTIDDIVKSVKEKEKLIEEPQEVTEMIKNATNQLISSITPQRPVYVITDYDADGICAGYITEKLIKSINPQCEVSVHCNDRRGSYGISQDIQGDGKSLYIVCDMGSNETPLIRERLGDDAFVFDHHLIKDDTIKQMFCDTNGNNTRLCDPHAFNEDDSKNAQYCATGLMYRAYQEAQIILGDRFHSTPVQDNSVAIVACIGTACDMVNVLDIHSYNRDILKNGVQLINEIDESKGNADFVLCYLLNKCSLSPQTDAHEVSFNVGALLNCGGRMSDMLNANGAQMTYDALSGNVDDWRVYDTINRLIEINQSKKNTEREILSGDKFEEFYQKEMFGENKDDTIALYIMPEGYAHGMAGLIANKLSGQLDKATIILANNNGEYSGSCRNVESNYTSIKVFMDNMLAKEKEIFGDEKLQVKYGGHANAMGISSINDIDRFVKLFDACKDTMLVKDNNEKVFLNASIKDLRSASFANKLNQLQPTGIGNSLPKVIIEGTEKYRDGNFMKNNPKWKKIGVTDDNKTMLSVNDWDYDAKKYPQTTDGKISFIADIGLKNGKTECAIKFDREFLKDRQISVEKENQKSVQPTKTDSAPPFDSER